MGCISSKVDSEYLPSLPKGAPGLSLSFRESLEDQPDGKALYVEDNESDSSLKEDSHPQREKIADGTRTLPKEAVKSAIEQRPSEAASRLRNVRDKPKKEWGSLHEINTEKVSNLQELPASYPPPEPPSCDKSTYLKGVDFAKIDKLARNAPEGLLDDYNALAEFIRSETEGELFRVRAILVWLADVYSGQFEELQSTKGREAFARVATTVKNANTPREGLSLVEEEQINIATVFALCCRKSGVRCVVIRGLWKTDEYNVGDGVLEEGVWNAVFINGSWRFVHPHLSVNHTLFPASLKNNSIVSKSPVQQHWFDDYFFLTNPDELVTRCFPEDSRWQLLRTPSPKERFFSMPFFTDQFFKLGLSLLNNRVGTIEAVNGKSNINVHFSGKQPQLYYLLQSKNHGFKEEPDLRTCVFMYKTDYRYVLSLRFKEGGLYVLSVYGTSAKHVESPNREPMLVFKLQIECNEPDKLWRPVPVCPLTGWGQSALAAKLGIVPVSHKGGLAYSNEHGKASFKFRVNVDVELQGEITTSSGTPKEPKYESKGDKVVMVVVLDKMEETYFYVNARVKNSENEFANVCNFIIRPQTVTEEKETARERRLKNLLEATTNTGTLGQLTRAINLYCAYVHNDTGELEKAEEKLLFLQLRANLCEAIMRDFAPFLEVAIYDAETSKFSEKLKSYIHVAKTHLHNLKPGGAYRNRALPLNQSLLLEIRGYMKPKSVIFDIILAALLLLGEKKGNLKEWKYLRSVMCRTGKEGILYRLEHFDPSEADSARVEDAKTLWERHPVEKVWESSAGAAVVYRWVKEAIEKIYGECIPKTEKTRGTDLQRELSQLNSELKETVDSSTRNKSSTKWTTSSAAEQQNNMSVPRGAAEESPLTAREINPELNIVSASNEDFFD